VPACPLVFYDLGKTGPIIKNLSKILKARTQDFKKSFQKVAESCGKRRDQRWCDLIRKSAVWYYQDSKFGRPWAAAEGLRNAMNEDRTNTTERNADAAGPGGGSIYEGVVPIDLASVRTYELATRPSKVTVGNFASAVTADTSMKAFLESLPDVLAVRSIRELATRIRLARDKGKPIIWGLGGHVVKTGLSPVLIDLMRKGFLTAIAANGSVLVHDTEIAIAGFTSEDVDATLGKGDFGAAKETGDILNSAAVNAQADGIGLGEAMGRELAGLDPKHAASSLLCAAYSMKLPVTVHLAIGADIGHFHPTCDGAALGAATHTDFRLLCSLVREMDGGGVYLNCGSAVMLPEVFLKAVTVVRNLGHELRDITTANFDFVQHYRPLTNVVKRPTADGAGRGFAITGHHELTLPLLAALLVCGE
jgi:hypothetical protein